MHSSLFMNYIFIFILYMIPIKNNYYEDKIKMKYILK